MEDRLDTINEDIASNFLVSNTNTNANRDQLYTLTSMNSEREEFQQMGPNVKQVKLVQPDNNNIDVDAISLDTRHNTNRMSFLNQGPSITIHKNQNQDFIKKNKDKQDDNIIEQQEKYKINEQEEVNKNNQKNKDQEDKINSSDSNSNSNSQNSYQSQSQNQNNQQNQQKSINQHLRVNSRVGSYMKRASVLKNPYQEQEPSAIISRKKRHQQIYLEGQTQQIFTQKINRTQTVTQSMKRNNQFQQLSKVNKVNIFKQKLLQSICHWEKKKTLKLKDYKLIGDVVWFGEKFIHDHINMKSNKGQKNHNSKVKLVSQIKSMCVFIKEQGCKINVINPNNCLLYLWDVVMIITVALFTFYIPVRWATYQLFEELTGEESANLYLITAFTVFIIDIIIVLNVGYYDKGHCVMNRQKVAQKYLEEKLYKDILSFLPLLDAYFNFPTYLQFLNIGIIFKVTDIFNIIDKFLQILRQKRQKVMPFILRIFKLFFGILLAAHLIGCAFLWLGVSMEYTNDTWLNSKEIEDESWKVQYAYCLYWAVTTLSTVGYGDITPTNPTEMIFITFIMLIACFVFGYIFSLIGTIVDELQKEEVIYQEKMQLISQYFNDKNIPKDLRNEVRKYMQYKHLAEQSLSINQSREILEDIPQDLRKKLIQSANRPYLDSIQFFKDNFSDQFLEGISLKMEEIQVVNEENILTMGEYLENGSMYFILQGEISIYQPIRNTHNQICGGQTLYTLKKGQYIGEMQCLFDSYCEISAKSIGSTLLLKLSRSTFMQQISLYPVDYEKYRFLNDQFKVNGRRHYLDKKCFNCLKHSHIIYECPLVHYIPDKEKLIIFNNKNIVQLERNKEIIQNENRREKYNSLYNLCDIQDDQEIWMEDTPSKVLEKCFRSQFLTGYYGQQAYLIYSHQPYNTTSEQTIQQDEDNEDNKLSFLDNQSDKGQHLLKILEQQIKLTNNKNNNQNPQQSQFQFANDNTSIQVQENQNIQEVQQKGLGFASILKNNIQQQNNLISNFSPLQEKSPTPNSPKHSNHKRNNSSLRNKQQRNSTIRKQTIIRNYSNNNSILGNNNLQRWQGQVSSLNTQNTKKKARLQNFLNKKIVNQIKKASFINQNMQDEKKIGQENVNKSDNEIEIEEINFLLLMNFDMVKMQGFKRYFANNNLDKTLLMFQLFQNQQENYIVRDSRYHLFNRMKQKIINQQLLQSNADQDILQQQIKLKNGNNNTIKLNKKKSFTKNKTQQNKNLQQKISLQNITNNSQQSESD